MDTYNYELQQTREAQAASKKKMILGIVFSCIGEFMLGIFLGIVELAPEAGLLFFFISLPFLGVGIPFLIKGIIGVIQNNKKMNSLKQQNYTATSTGQNYYGQVGYQQPTYYPQNGGYPPSQPTYQPMGQPVYTQPAPQPMYTPQPEAEQTITMASPAEQQEIQE